MTKRWNPRLAMLLLTVLVLGVSCADDSSQMGPTATPEFIEILGPEAPAGVAGSAVKGRSAAMEASQLVTPEAGGTVAFGRATVVIPPDALRENTQITVRSTDDALVGCELGPHGIAFDRPVTLQFDLKGTEALPTDDLTIYWFNEETGAWEDVGGTLDPATMVLSTKLEHFSQYRAGRAGW